MNIPSLIQEYYIALIIGALLGISGAWLYKTYGAKEPEDEMSAAEDLMREHGILRRTLLVYEELIRRMHHNEPYTHSQIKRAATIIKEFIEDYHEVLEENHIFPLFENMGMFVPLIKTLREQHVMGRTLTANIIACSELDQNDASKEKILESMRAFATLYRAHASHEDTDLFTQVHKVLSNEEFEEIEKLFESKESSMLGDDGFTYYLEEVRGLENELNISDINEYNPTPEELRGCKK